MQVHSIKKGSCWKHFWSNGEQSKEVAVTSRRWVNNAEVNNQKRRDVPTSRRLNVATLQRRDVSMGSALHHFKARMVRNAGGIGRRTNEGTEFQSRVA